MHVMHIASNECILRAMKDAYFISKEFTSSSDIFLHAIIKVCSYQVLFSITLEFIMLYYQCAKISYAFLTTNSMYRLLLKSHLFESLQYASTALSGVYRIHIFFSILPAHLVFDFSNKKGVLLHVIHSFHFIHVSI